MDQRPVIQDRHSAVVYMRPLLYNVIRTDAIADTCIGQRNLMDNSIRGSQSDAILGLADTWQDRCRPHKIFLQETSLKKMTDQA